MCQKQQTTASLWTMAAAVSMLQWRQFYQNWTTFVFTKEKVRNSTKVLLYSWWALVRVQFKHGDTMQLITKQWRQVLSLSPVRSPLLSPIHSNVSEEIWLAYFENDQRNVCPVSNVFYGLLYRWMWDKSGVFRKHPVSDVAGYNVVSDKGNDLKISAPPVPLRWLS